MRSSRVEAMAPGSGMSSSVRDIEAQEVGRAGQPQAFDRIAVTCREIDPRRKQESPPQTLSIASTKRALGTRLRSLQELVGEQGDDDEADQQGAGGGEVDGPAADAAAAFGSCAARGGTLLARFKAGPVLFSQRARSMMRASRVPMTLRMAPRPVSRKAGAMDS